MNIDREFEKAKNRVHAHINKMCEDILWKQYVKDVKDGRPWTAITNYKIKHQGLMVPGINC